MVPLVEPETRMVLEAPAGLVRVSARCSGGRVDDITFENVPSFCTALDAVGRGAGRGHAAGGCGVRRRVVRVRGRRLLWGTRSCRRRRGRWASWVSGSGPCVQEQLPIVHPLEEALSYLSFVVFVGAAAGGRRRAPRHDRVPRAARPLAHGHGDLGPDRGPGRARDDGRGVRRGERDRHPLRGRVARRAQVGTFDAVVPAITGRAWITGFHQLVVDPTDPLRGRLQAAGHLGGRERRGHAQPLNVETVTDTVTVCGPRRWRSWCALGPIGTSGVTSSSSSVNSSVAFGLRGAEIVVQPLALLGVHAQELELAEVALGGRDDHDPPVGFEHPAHLVGVARREDVEDDVGDAVLERQRVPGVAGDGGDPRMRPRGAPERGPRRVERDPARAGLRVQHRREVVPGAGPEVDDRPHRRRHRPHLLRNRARASTAATPGSPRRRRHDTERLAQARRCHYRLGDRGVVAGLQERDARRDHLRRVAARGLALERDVALPRDVEAVPVRAAPARARRSRAGHRNGGSETRARR